MTRLWKFQNLISLICQAIYCSCVPLIFCILFNLLYQVQRQTISSFHKLHSPAPNIRSVFLIISVCRHFRRFILPFRLSSKLELHLQLHNTIPRRHAASTSRPDQTKQDHRSNGRPAMDRSLPPKEIIFFFLSISNLHLFKNHEANLPNLRASCQTFSQTFTLKKPFFHRKNGGPYHHRAQHHSPHALDRQLRPLARSSKEVLAHFPWLSRRHCPLRCCHGDSIQLRTKGERGELRGGSSRVRFK